MRRPPPRFFPMVPAAATEKPLFSQRNPHGSLPSPSLIYRYRLGSEPLLPPPGHAGAGDVSPSPSPPRSSDFTIDSQRKDVDQWGDTFVPETYQESGDGADVSAVESEAAVWAGYVVADTYDGDVAAAPTLSGPNPKQLAVATAEEIKQSEWEEKMWKMLKRMEAKDSLIRH